MDITFTYTDLPTDEIAKLTKSLEKKNQQRELLLQSLGVGLAPSLGSEIRMAVMQNCIITKMRDMGDDLERNEAILNHMFQRELIEALDAIEVQARQMALTNGTGASGGLLIPGR